MLLKTSKGLIRVAERLLGLVGSPLPTEIEPRIQLGLEMRALRPWEFFDENIVQFHLSITVAAGGAGRFSGLTIPNGAGGQLTQNLPALVSITRIENNGATSCDVRSIPTTIGYANNVVGGVFPRDLRHGPSVEMFNGMVSGGDLATASPAGSQIVAGTFTAGETKDGLELTVEQRQGSTAGVVIMNGTANTALAVSIDGVVITRYRG